MISILIEEAMNLLEGGRRVKMETSLTHPGPSVEVDVKVIVSPYLAVFI